MGILVNKKKWRSAVPLAAGRQIHIDEYGVSLLHVHTLALYA